MILAILRDLPYSLEGVKGISPKTIKTFVTLNEYFDAVKAPSFNEQSICQLEEIGKREELDSPF